MAEETKKAIAEMAKAAEQNPEAKAFLEGLKCGLVLGKPKGENKED